MIFLESDISVLAGVGTHYLKVSIPIILTEINAYPKSQGLVINKGNVSMWYVDTCTHICIHKHLHIQVFPNLYKAQCDGSYWMILLNNTLSKGNFRDCCFFTFSCHHSPGNQIPELDPLHQPACRKRKRNTENCGDFRDRTGSNYIT